ncbi:MAG: S8 family serine peptidase [Nitrospirae bacterium]|nr:S8 family serine peptidase [Nitrospirota bacterium]
MRLIVLLCVVFIGCLLIPHLAVGVDKEVVYWYEGDVKRHAWMAEGQYAIFLTSGEQSVIRKVAEAFEPSARVIDRRGNTIFIETSKPVVLTSLPEGVSYISHVYYTGKGMTRRMALTGDIIVRYAKSCTEEQVSALEKQFGLRRKNSLVVPDSISGAYVYETTNCPISDPIGLANAIRKSVEVIYSYPNWLRHVKHRGLSSATPDDPLFPQQWHLKNTGQGNGLYGADINVADVWGTYRATTSQIIAVVDDGLEIGHEDLKANTIPNKSYNYLNTSTDPTPTSLRDSHGTNCAGLAAARGFNTIGVTGVAPAAGLVGYNLLQSFTDANSYDAMTRGMEEGRIYTNSWGPEDTGDILDAPAPLFSDALNLGTSKGRGGLGNIYIWAGGNGRTDDDNSNNDGYANSRYVFAVGATTNMGKQAYYSEDGANILVNAPSSGGSLDITTTDLTINGMYASDFSGTSAVAPMAAGAVALILEANPGLSWRDVRYILARSARKNDTTDADWIVNGAGLHVNLKYGFGTIDIAEAINQAKTWNNLPRETSISKTSKPNKPIPDNYKDGIDDKISLSDDMPQDLVVEFVEVYFDASDHLCFTDLDVTLTSPSGTKSVLAQAHSTTMCPSEYSYDNWRFGSVRHLGEPAKGTWSLHVADRLFGNTGTLKSWGIKLYGHSKTLLPRIFANGKALQTTVSSKDNLSITVSLTSSQYAGKSADWWLLAVGPNGVRYYFNAWLWAWVSGSGASYQGPLFDLPASSVFNGNGLPPGVYTVTFGVDLTPNGVFYTDFFVYDSVDITVTP